MAIKEQDIVFTTKDESGNTIIQMPITRAGNIEDVMSIQQGGTGATTVAAARNALGLGNTSGAVPIANGGTGAVTAASARTNLGLSTAVTGASISGKVITLTFADGTTKTLTTQDTEKKFYGLTELSSGNFTATCDGFLSVVSSSNSNAQFIQVYNNSVLMASHYDHHASQAFGITPFKAGDVLSVTGPGGLKYYKMELR